MMMIERAIRRIAILGLAMGFAACQSTHPALVLAPEDFGTSAIQFDDVPVPAGMKLSTGPAYSHSHEVGSFRYGDFEYKGHVPIERVVDYMRNRMGVHDWQLVEFETSDEATDLHFAREPYLVGCHIWREASLTRLRITVRTEVGVDAGTAGTGSR